MRAIPPTPAQRNPKSTSSGRAWRRRQSARAIAAGFGAQLLATTAGLLMLHTVVPGRGESLWNALLIAVSVGPAWAAGVAIGRSAPILRWWQMAAAGILTALLFFAVSLLYPLHGGAPATFRWWLAVNLAAGPAIAALVGQRWRRLALGLDEDQDPEPWR